MKTKLLLFVAGSSLVLAASALPAQTTNSLTESWKYQAALASESSLSEQSILPDGLKEKLNLTDAQKAELKPIEDDFTKTCREFQAANQPRIDAAEESDRRARAAKDEGQIQAAHRQMLLVWAGLQPYRTTAVSHVKSLLTPDQLKVLEDANNPRVN